MGPWLIALLLRAVATILITGGSGLVGRALTQKLVAAGHSVRWLSRTPGHPEGVRCFMWDIANGTIDPASIYGADHIVHLSGAGIADKRWTQRRVHELCASRGGAARLLLREVERTDARPASFISASGTGFYGAVSSDHVSTENDTPGTDTIARITADWEAAADEWAPLCRSVKLRTPMVLAKEGGALRRLSTPFRYGLGSALGSGRQWMPWVHLSDLTDAYVKAIADDTMQGAYNVTAPEQPMNVDFMRAVAKALGRPFFLPAVPGFALRSALGEMATILLEGTRASNEKILSAGFHFRYGTLDSALRETLGADRA